MEILTETDIREVTQKVIETFVIPDFEKRGHDASGNWKRSVAVRTEVNKGIITAPDYTGTLTDGRGPNKDQNPENVRKWVMWFAPNVFAPWLDAKGLIGNPYTLAYNIARYGTDIYKKGGSDFLEVLYTPEVQNFIVTELGNKLKVRVVERLTEEILRLKNA